MIYEDCSQATIQIKSLHGFVFRVVLLLTVAWCMVDDYWKRMAATLSRPFEVIFRLFRMHQTSFSQDIANWQTIARGINSSCLLACGGGFTPIRLSWKEMGASLTGTLVPVRICNIYDICIKLSCVQTDIRHYKLAKNV